MFKQIAEMLEEGSAMVLTVAKEKAGRLCVQVRPVGEFKNAALGQGLTFTESAEVIEAEFVDVLKTYGTAHKSLKEQVEDRVRVMAAAEQAEKAAKADAIKKAGAKTGAKPATTGVQPKKAQESAGAALEGPQGGGGDDGEADDAAAPTDELTLF